MRDDSCSEMMFLDFPSHCIRVRWLVLLLVQLAHKFEDEHPFVSVSKSVTLVSYEGKLGH